MPKNPRKTFQMVPTDNTEERRRNEDIEDIEDLDEI
jgi:hypothetical protein